MMNAVDTSAVTSRSLAWRTPSTRSDDDVDEQHVEHAGEEDRADDVEVVAGAAAKSAKTAS